MIGLDYTDIVLAVLTMVSGWVTYWLDRRKHRQASSGAKWHSCAMRYRLSRLALIATAALLWTGCSTTRMLKSDVRSQMYEVTRDTVLEEVALVVHDTLREVTTITIRQNEAGDTLKVTQVTDRDRLRSKADVRSKKEVVRVERDTIYVEKRDSVVVREAANISHHTSSISHLLKWIFWILCAIIVLIIIIKIWSRRSLF